MSCPPTKGATARTCSQRTASQPVVLIRQRPVRDRDGAPAATLERFVPHDPDRAGCELEIEGPTPG
jgi:hypothetical protein